MTRNRTAVIYCWGARDFGLEGPALAIIIEIKKLACLHQYGNFVCEAGWLAPSI
jgi:hypothetical protein